MSGVAGEARAARRRLTAVPVPTRLERLSLIALGRRHLLRAQQTQDGCSVAELLIERGRSGLWLVALTARAELASIPVEDATSIQVIQGRVRVPRDGFRPAMLPGDLALGPVALREIIALTDTVLVVTGTPAPHLQVPA